MVEKIDSALVRKEKLIEQVKMLGQEVIDRAEDIVGDNDFRYSLEVRLIFTHEEPPEIECTTTYLSRRFIEGLNNISIPTTISQSGIPLNSIRESCGFEPIINKGE